MKRHHKLVTRSLLSRDLVADIDTFGQAAIVTGLVAEMKSEAIPKDAINVDASIWVEDLAGELCLEVWYSRPHRKGKWCVSGVIECGK